VAFSYYFTSNSKSEDLLTSGLHRVSKNKLDMLNEWLLHIGKG
jgi:hypothetical protein